MDGVWTTPKLHHAAEMVYRIMKIYECGTETKKEGAFC